MSRHAGQPSDDGPAGGLDRPDATHDPEDDQRPAGRVAHAELAARVTDDVQALVGDTAVLAIGVDIEDVARWREPKRRLDRIFTPAELAYAARKSDPAPTYAGLWCAREAAWKALSRFSPLGQRQLAVAHDHAGAPRIVALAERDVDLVSQVRLSISHGAATAIAVAVLCAAYPLDGPGTDRPH